MGYCLQVGPVVDLAVAKALFSGPNPRVLLDRRPSPWPPDGAIFSKPSEVAHHCLRVHPYTVWEKNTYLEMRLYSTVRESLFKVTRAFRKYSGLSSPALHPRAQVFTLYYKASVVEICLTFNVLCYGNKSIA